MVMHPPSKVSGPMTESFDPYRKWLGIAPKDLPPHHYRLLGIPTFESDPDVIENAAARQMSHVRTFQGSKHAAISQRILTELSAAKLCLLTPERKAVYDGQLRARLQAEGKLSSDNLLSSAIPVRAAAIATAQPAASNSAPEVPRVDERWRTEEPTPSPHAELAPVPIPMPTGPSAVALPVLRRNAPALMRSRRNKNAVPLLITIVSLIVLLGGAGVAAVVVGNRLQEETGTSTNHPAQPAATRPAARTE
jgi:hypothetical protein